MKIIIKALLAPCMSVAAAFLLAACGPSTLDFRNAEVVNGKIFRAGADKPYSGNLTNAPARAVIVGRKDYAAYHQILSNVYSSLGIQADIYTAVAACDVHVDQGILEGKAVCRATADQLLSDEMSFDKGALDGRIKTYFPRNGGKLAAEAQFDNGVLDGDMTMFGPESGRKILQMSFKQGKVHGKQEIADDETGKLVSRATYSKGLVDGALVRYSRGTDRLEYRVRMVDGIKDGIEENYDVFSGKLRDRRGWKMGKPHGDVVVAMLDSDRNTTDELQVVARYDNGVQVPLAPTAKSAATAVPPGTASNVQGCVDTQIVAFRVQHGEDELITADQLGEWETECRSGKRPG
ncbi:toxin-antitoxin system YwqK family antitoxin [Variovorax sp. YR566]|uniref:toxin-antitoxin system YwqK family antitoxin n=1 Tax=Variovorax sp. YR566 TaxID=3450237 RepID=UPI003F7FD827